MSIKTQKILTVNKLPQVSHFALGFIVSAFMDSKLMR